MNPQSGATSILTPFHGGDDGSRSTTSFEQLYYENPVLWEASALGADDHRRVAEVLERVPKDATSLIDVGCGNGICCNRAAAVCPSLKRVVGCDRSSAALEHVAVEKRLSDICRLPFGNDEFDVAVSLEVLEHLPVGTYDAARRELARIARRAIIVTVPWRERLAAAAVQCPICETRFHRYLHVRSFGHGTISRLFDDHGFRCREATALPGPARPYCPEMFRPLAARVLGRHRFMGATVCPVCGHHEPGATARRPAARGSTPWPRHRRPKWWLAVYER